MKIVNCFLTNFWIIVSIAIIWVEGMKIKLKSGFNDMYEYEYSFTKDSKKLKEIIREYNETIQEYNTTIHEQKGNITKLENKEKLTEEENFKLKKTIESLKKKLGIPSSKEIPVDDVDNKLTSNSNNKELLPNSDNFSSSLLVEKKLENYFEKYFDYQGFYQQLEMQRSREKELRDSVEEKMRHLDQVEKKLEGMYSDIQSGVKDRVDKLEKKFLENESSNNDLSRRVYAIEKEKEKEQLSRDMIKKGISQIQMNDLIEPECINRNSCRVCLEDPKCVWCSIEQKCKSGDLSGPFDGTCLSSFQYSTCSSNICTSMTCSECIRDPNCGWCNSENRCMEGSSKGSIGYMCSGKFIHLDNDQKCDILFL
jgi:hypothetical protein